jgi:hypothetical protein
VFDADDDVLDRLDRLMKLDGGTAPWRRPAGCPAFRPAFAWRRARLRHRRAGSELREANAARAGPRVATGMGHAQVNGQLNRLVRLRRIDEATVDQLRRRARQAERWLATL